MQITNPVAVLEEIIRQQNNKVDYSVPSRSIVVEPNARNLHFTIDGDIVATDISEVAHTQLANISDVDNGYYRKLREQQPDLAAYNINQRLQFRKDQPQLVRTLSYDDTSERNTRAVLSASYAIRDNIGAVNAILPLANGNEGIQLRTTGLTEENLSLQIMSPKKAAVAVGDIVQAGLGFSNSEVGLGASRFWAWLLRLKCLNGLAVPESIAGSKFTKTHLGARRKEFGKLAGLVSERSRQMEEEAFWAAQADIARELLNGDFLENVTSALRESREHTIDGEPVKAVEVATKRLLMTEDEQNAVIRHLLGDQEAGGLTKYGLINAITSTARELKEENFTRSMELEKIGGSLLVLPKNDWSAIASAA